jgi:hypothetical protein
MEDKKEESNGSTPPIQHDSPQVTTKKEIHWKANEYVYHEKTVDWYWYFGLTAVVLAGSAIWLHNILFAVIIIIGAFTMLLYANKHPRELEYTANNKEIFFDENSYLHEDIRYFCIINDPKISEEKILLLQLKKATSIMVTIPLGNADLDELRSFLLSFIEEHKLAIPFGQVLMSIIGF